jgi:hypothetical protein
MQCEHEQCTTLYAYYHITTIVSGGEIFRTRPDRPWGPPNLLYNGYRVTFPGVNRSGRGADHQPPSSAEDKIE